MTIEERVFIARELWQLLGGLVSSKQQARFAELSIAVDAVYTDHFTAAEVIGFERGRVVAQTACDDARREGFAAGAMSVEKRRDWRDPEDVLDPEELRSNH